MLTRNALRFIPALALLLGLLVLPAPADSAGLVGKGEIRKSGREAAAAIEKKEGLYQSSGTQRRVQTIGNELAREAKYQEGTIYAFQVLDMDDVNAFALPSGHVYVTSGLIKLVGNDDDLLAAVLAHEIGHLSELHSHKRVEKVLTQSLAFGFLGAIFKDEIGKEGQMVAGVVNAFLTAEYSQDQELASDKYGIVLTDLAGYDPTSMSAFLRKLAETEKSNELEEYFGSHPNSDKRARLADEFLTTYQNGEIELERFTSPSPPASAFDYQYPTIKSKSGSTGKNSGSSSKTLREAGTSRD